MPKIKISLLALLISQSVHAETLTNDASANDAPTTNDNIERLVVTGSRIVESIDEVPASVSVINQSALVNQLQLSSNIQNILSLYVPGISAANGTSSNFAQTLRGRAALVMIDGVPQSTPLRNGALGVRTLDPSIIERIEVINGATSIYGNGAAGGIINYITKRPDGNNSFNLDVNLATRFSAVKLEDSIGTKATTTAYGTLDKFSYIVSAGIEENGILRDAEGDALGTQYGLSEAEAQNYFTKLGYQFDENKHLQFTYNYYESQQDSDWVDVIGDISLGEKTYAIKDSTNKPSNAAPQGPRGNHNFQLKYSDTEIFANTQLDIDLYKQTIENVFFYSTVLANPDLGLPGGQSLIKSKKQGLRATFNSQFEWDNIEATLIYGIDALNDITSQPLVDGRIWVPEMDMSNIAGFLQTKWIVAEDYIFKAGIRNENMEIKVDDYHTLKLCRSAEQCSVPMAVTGDNIDFDANTYNLAFRYNGYQKFSPYISYSEGADIPDLGALLRSATVNDISLIQTKAAIVKNYEVGFISDFDQLRVELATYRSYSDLGSNSVMDPKTGIYITQRAPQKIWGYEGVMSYRFSDAFNIAATYSYVEGKHRNTDIYLGGRQISAPKGTLIANWTPTEQAKISISYLHVDNRKRFKRNENNKYIGDEGAVNGYDIVNVNGSYDFGDWSVFAGIENLFNRDYFPVRSQALTYKAFNVKGLGTTVNLGVNYKF